MNTIKNGQSRDILQSTSSQESNVLAETVTHKSYHEMADFPLVEGDVLSQLHLNLIMLDDMQARHAFLLKEIRYLLKV